MALLRPPWLTSTGALVMRRGWGLTCNRCNGCLSATLEKVAKCYNAHMTYEQAPSTVVRPAPVHILPFKPFNDQIT